MLIAPCPAGLIKNARTQKNLSQSQLSELTEIARVRISDLECKKSAPTPHEQAQLCLVLEIAPRLFQEACPSTRKPVIPTPQRWSKFEVLKDRPNEARWHSARQLHPKFMRNAEIALRNREDSDWIRIFFREARFDSYLELIFSLHLLLDGAKPGWLSPQKAGFDSLPIIDPATKRIIGHRLHPAISWKQRVMFPQLTIKGPRLTGRVDMLIGSKNGKRMDWLDLELDGPGHQARWDHEREFGLGLPILRFSTHQITSGSILDELVEALN